MGAGRCDAPVLRRHHRRPQGSPEGTALLHNETGKTNLRIVVRNTDGDVIGKATFDEGYQFDTQFPDRQKQCLVARDGGFKIFGPAGEVLATHNFADRSVCSLDELVLRDDGSVVWQ